MTPEEERIALRLAELAVTHSGLEDCMPPKEGKNYVKNHFCLESVVDLTNFWYKSSKKSYLSYQTGSSKRGVFPVAVCSDHFGIKEQIVLGSSFAICSDWKSNSCWKLIFRSDEI